MKINFKKIAIIGLSIFFIVIMGCMKLNVKNKEYLLCNQTSNGSMAETEEGYFFAYDSILYYADKNNMELWLPVCNKPDCNHRDKYGKALHDCNAYLTTNNVITQKNGKLYGLDYTEINPFIYEIATDGSGLKNIYDVHFDVNPDGYSVALFQNQYVINYSYLDEYGMYQENIISLEDGLEEDEKKDVLISNLYSGTEATTILSGNQYWSIRGDNLILSTIKLAEGTDAMRNFCKIENEEIIPLNLPEEINALGGCMNGDVFTYYQPQEGFYKYNIKTGEKKFICENQLEDGRGYILNDTYMFESNKYMNYLPEEAYLKIYNGKEWVDVELLEEISKYERDSFVPTCVTSDRMFFRRSHKWNDGTLTIYLYYIMLDEENPKLVRASTFGEKEKEETLIEDVDTSVYAKFEEIVVFDNEEYVLKITDMYLDYSNNFCVDMYFENKREDITYLISAPNWTINGIQSTTYWGGIVSANEAWKDTLRFNKKLMGNNQLPDFYDSTEYTEIKMCCYVYEEVIGDDNILVEKKDICIYPQGEENITHFSRESQDTDLVLVDNEYISVTVIGYEETLIPNDTINVLIENKTDSIIQVKVAEGSVNGIAIEPVPYPEDYSEEYIYDAYFVYISPGAVGMYPMTLFDGGSPEGPHRLDPDDSFLTKYNITNIEEITMRLEIKEESLWDDKGEEEVFLDKTFVLNP